MLSRHGGRHLNAQQEQQGAQAVQELGVGHHEEEHRHLGA